MITKLSIRPEKITTLPCETQTSFSYQTCLTKIVLTIL